MFYWSPRDETRSKRHQRQQRISEYFDSSTSSHSSCHQCRRVQQAQSPQLPSDKQHQARENVCVFNTPKRQRTLSPMEARFTSRHYLRRRSPSPYRRNDFEKRQRAPRIRRGSPSPKRIRTGSKREGSISNQNGRFCECMQYSYDGSETKYPLARQIKQLLGRSRKEDEDSHDPSDATKEEWTLKLK